MSLVHITRLQWEVGRRLYFCRKYVRPNGDKVKVWPTVPEADKAFRSAVAPHGHLLTKKLHHAELRLSGMRNTLILQGTWERVLETIEEYSDRNMLARAKVVFFDHWVRELEWDAGWTVGRLVQPAPKKTRKKAYKPPHKGLKPYQTARRTRPQKHKHQAAPWQPMPTFSVAHQPADELTGDEFLQLQFLIYDSGSSAVKANLAIVLQFFCIALRPSRSSE
jgi:hypothetical protein